MHTLVVFSHLRWNFVYQRPQHLMARLGRRRKVVFIEEPVCGAAEDLIELIDAAPGVTVWRPHVRGSAPGFHAEHEETLLGLLQAAAREQDLGEHWIWFYTPMALGLAEVFSPAGVIYDCMDELSAFRHAPPQLIAREDALFQRADLVFTGGQSLYDRKRSRHANIHCFPSSVDAQHFTRRRGEHDDQRHLPHPRLGYCGVIDERLDLDIVDGIAAARPQWQIVMVGPVAKIDTAALPRRPNIHWLGQRDYAQLPAFISGWDVCLMPFALNDATRYISPTKTLEYMACGKPSVSTAIRDVVEPYGHVVPIEADAAGFVRACDAILGRSPAEHEAHARTLAEIIGRTSWDATAGFMEQLILEAQAARRTPRSAQATVAAG